MSFLALPVHGKQKRSKTSQKDEGRLSFVFFAMITMGNHTYWALLIGYYSSKCARVFIKWADAKTPSAAAYTDVKPPEFGSSRPPADDAPATGSKSGAKRPLYC